MAEGYGYLDLPFRSRADDQVAVVIQRFASADEAFRDALRDRLSLSQYDMVLAFAIRMAMVAVRERSAARLRLGAQAVALAGDAPTSDWRETAEALLPLRDAARVSAPMHGRCFRMRHVSHAGEPWDRLPAWRTSPRSWPRWSAS